MCAQYLSLSQTKIYSGGSYREVFRIHQNLEDVPMVLKTAPLSNHRMKDYE